MKPPTGIRLLSAIMGLWKRLTRKRGLAMAVDWAPFVDLVRRHQRFLLTTHVRPDGDGLGSMLALADALEQLGKQCRQVIMSVLPPRYRFLDPRQRIPNFELAGDTLRAAALIRVLHPGT